MTGVAPKWSTMTIETKILFWITYCFKIKLWTSIIREYLKMILGIFGGIYWYMCVLIFLACACERERERRSCTWLECVNISVSMHDWLYLYVWCINDLIFHKHIAPENCAPARRQEVNLNWFLLCVSELFPLLLLVCVTFLL